MPRARAPLSTEIRRHSADGFELQFATNHLGPYALTNLLLPQLVNYSRQTDAAHLPAWRAFNRLARTSDAVGIWHETYRIAPGQSETIYGAMPAVGLAGAFGRKPLERSSTSKTRIGDIPTGHAPVAAPNGEPEMSAFR